MSTTNIPMLIAQNTHQDTHQDTHQENSSVFTSIKETGKIENHNLRILNYRLFEQITLFEQLLDNRSYNLLKIIKIKLNRFTYDIPNIPPNVFEILEKELILFGLCKEDITLHHLKKILRKHKLMQYLDNISYIYTTFTNKPYIFLDIHEYNRIIIRYIVIIYMFFVLNNMSQYDFLHISSVLHMILLAENRSDIAEYFPLLKAYINNKQFEISWSFILKNFENGYASACKRVTFLYNKKNKKEYDSFIDMIYADQLSLDLFIDKLDTDNVNVDLNADNVNVDLNADKVNVDIDTDNVNVDLNADKIFIDPLIKTIDTIQSWGYISINKMYDTYSFLFSNCMNQRIDTNNNNEK